MLFTRKVLIVEDDACLQTPLKRVISGIDPEIEVAWVSTVKEAKRELATGHYSLILADYTLDEEQTGLDLWHFCTEKHPDVPFILISAIEVQSFLKLVGTETSPPFLPKPFYMGECRQLIEHFLH